MWQRPAFPPGAIFPKVRLLNIYVHQCSDTREKTEYQLYQWTFHEYKLVQDALMRKFDGKFFD